MEANVTKVDEANTPAERQTSQLVDWFHEGESKEVSCGGVTVTVRYVNRGGRRARISITAPAGAVFKSGEEAAGSLQSAK